MTGKQFEEELLPECPWHNDGNYCQFWPSVRLVEQNQPDGWDPTDPKGKMNDVHFLLAEALGVELFEVQLLTSLGSPLDHFHGIDCFVKFGEAFVGIDVTMNRHKTEGKALILPAETLAEEDGLKAWCEGVAGSLRRQQSRVATAA